MYFSTGTCFSARSSTDFFADSGATHHMSDQASYFSSMTPIVKGTWLVKGIGGVLLPVLGQGTIDFTATINGKQCPGRFKNVLFVPSLNANLISIGTAAKAGAKILFSESEVEFKLNGRVILTGLKSAKGLYHLNMTIDGNDSTAAAVAKKHVSLSIIHQRFAHLNCRAIRRMHRLKTVEGLDLDDPTATPDPCNGCIYGKTHRTPFQKGRTRATRPDQIIHSDVGGPFRICSICGGGYYVIFKNDFSGFSVGHIIKHKSEVKDLFVKFCASTKRQNGRQVEILRTDMGKEYEGKWFDEWLAKEGIKHETTASYTPQQNGVAERANRTFMEAERSIMFNNPKSELNKQRKSLLELWGPFLIASIYVRNRSMTNSEELTPYEKYFDKVPKVDHLRVPGCRAIVYVPSAHRHKLEPKAVDCWFIGYAETQKTWLFWNEDTRKVISSRDATFFENQIYTGRSDEKTSKERLEFAEPILIVTELLRKQPENDDPIEPLVIIEQNGDDAAVPNDSQNLVLDEADDAVPSPNALHPPEPFNDVEVEPAAQEVQPMEEAAQPLAPPQLPLYNGLRRSSRTPKYTPEYIEYMNGLANIADWVHYGNTHKSYYFFFLYFVFNNALSID